MALEKIAEEKLKNLEEQKKKDEKIKVLLSQIDELYISTEKERRENTSKVCCFSVMAVFSYLHYVHCISYACQKYFV